MIRIIIYRLPPVGVNKSIRIVVGVPITVEIAADTAGSHWVDT
jgi:hypothetical protein